MCNVYSVTKSQQAIRDLVMTIRDITGNMPHLFAGRWPGKVSEVLRRGENLLYLILPDSFSCGGIQWLTEPAVQRDMTKRRRNALLTSPVLWAAIVTGISSIIAAAVQRL